ncbi:MAG: PDZ domain-containing protein [Planctomycetales bacterium]|nr:PDZ domain-containing protein [Planctomycetales bacterium]
MSNRRVAKNASTCWPRFPSLALQAGFIFAGLLSSVSAQDLNTPFVSWEKPTQKLQNATVTVRILYEQPKVAGEKTESANPVAGPAEKSATEKNDQRPSTVIVCSGLCVARNKFITAVQVGTDSQIRFTFPGGSQGDARLRVIDEFSGLAILESKGDAATPIELAAAPAAAGSWVMTGSAWGVEKPIVSLGIVGAVDRTLTGGGYPPLLQCDVRTTDTSCGAGVVNSQGKLVGVVIGTDKPEAQRGWAYAVPVTHVQRLLRVAEGAKETGGKENDKSVIVLKRRRPVVGMQLDSQADGAIIVRRVVAGGPAEKAGLRIGDQVTATDGIRIRSVYQATVPTLHKQPGDTITFTIERDSKPQDIQVTLGGGVELPSLPENQLADVIQPKVQMRRDSKGSYIRGQDEKPESLPFTEGPRLKTATDSASPADKIAILEKAMDRYQKVIELQQQQLKHASENRRQLEESLELLKSDLETLRKKVQPSGDGAKKEAATEGSKK